MPPVGAVPAALQSRRYRAVVRRPGSVKDYRALAFTARCGLGAALVSEALLLVSVTGLLLTPSWLPALLIGGLVLAAASTLLIAASGSGTPGERLLAAVGQVLSSGRAVGLLAKELRVLASLGPWLRGQRVGVGPSDHTIGYHSGLRTTVLVLVGLSLGEVVLVHLLLPWPWLQAVLFVLGLYGAVLALAFLANLAVRPHVVRTDGVLLRSGAEHEIAVGWSQIASVCVRLASPSRSNGLHVADSVASLPVSGTTNVALRLGHPLLIGGGEVTELRFFADEPATACTQISRAAAEARD